MTVELTHGRVRLALHTLRAGEGPPLLLLHGLGERSPETIPDAIGGWPGSIYALDFTGHGKSTLPHGGGYTAEQLMADADIALSHVGRATIVGFGLGGYIGALLAGARPSAVCGAVVCDGPGLAGGGSSPGPMAGPVWIEPSATTPDPFAVRELDRDLRPPDYATSLVAQAVALSGVDQPIAVSASARPDWLAAVAVSPGVEVCDVATALGRYAAAHLQ